jgi:hypothetical protein
VSRATGHMVVALTGGCETVVQSGIVWWFFDSDCGRHADRTPVCARRAANRSAPPHAQTRHALGGAPQPALIRTIQNTEYRIHYKSTKYQYKTSGLSLCMHVPRSRAAKSGPRHADGDHGAPTARRHCSGARGGIPMRSTGPTSTRWDRRARLPQV